MSDDSSSSARRADTGEGGRIWRGLKSMFGIRPAPTAREQLEEFLEGDGELVPGVAGDGDADDLAPVERQMLLNLLHFGDLNADDAAVPRSDIIAIEEGASFDELVAKFAEAGHSRLPVYRETLDQVVGMIHVKDVFAILASGEAPPADAIQRLLRQPRYVPQSMGALELLAEMRATRTHLAIVLDEYSGTDGLVTIEDLMEEIVGNIEDEHDDEPVAQVVRLDDGLWELDARVELEDLGDEFDDRLAEVEEDVETIGGLAVVLAGHVPQVGEVIAHPSGWQIEVVSGDERRVERVRLHRPAEASAMPDAD